jgi:hypothetical protein
MPLAAGHDYANYFPRRANAYVGNLIYAADVTQDGIARVEYGAPPTSSANAIINAQDISAAITKGGVIASTFKPATMMSRYGRNLILALSGAGTPVVTVYGRDYLGQPMSEQITATGAASKAGLKAFYSVESISTALVAATTLNLGFGISFGVPYATLKLNEEWVDDAAPTAGAITLYTATQTATSADPRGLYTPNAAPNGTRVYTIITRVLQGNLHGARHYAL